MILLFVLVNLFISSSITSIEIDNDCESIESGKYSTLRPLHDLWFPHSEAEELFSVGWRATCLKNHGRVLIHSLRNDCGMGSELHWLTVAMSISLHTDRRLVLEKEVEPWIYGGGNCGSFSCLFEPVCGGSDAPVVPDHVPVLETKKSMFLNEDVVRWTTDLQQQLDFHFFRHVPPLVQQLARTHGGFVRSNTLFWYRAQLAKLLVQPRPHVWEFIDSERRRFRLYEQFLGMHYRAGDKAYGSKINRPELDHLIDPKVALDHAEAVANKHSIAKIYLSTKDPVIAELAAERDRFVVDGGVNRRGRGWSTEEFLSTSSEDFNRTAESVEAIRDLMILASADLLLGQLESNFYRLAVELNAANHASIGPPYALQRDSWFVFP